MCCVFDDRKNTWSNRAVPLSFGPHCLHVPMLTDLLVSGAKGMDALSLKALRLMAVPVTRKKTKK